MLSIRAHRIESEWRILVRLAETNPEVLTDPNRDIDQFVFELRRSAALVMSATGPAQIVNYGARIVFPEFFPAVPMQAFVTAPVIHPNVHPITRFVCIWDRTSPGDSVAQAILQLQRVVSWTLFNENPDHLMQPDAFDRHPSRQALPFEKLSLPPGLDTFSDFRVPVPQNFRRRLSPL